MNAYTNTLVTLCLCAGSSVAEPFTYQGQLMDNGAPANGLYNMTFTLTDTPVGGLALAFDSINNVAVVDGIFTVEVDFPSSLLNDDQRWMSINVQGTALSPRVRLRDTPRAQNAVRANTAGSLEFPFDVLDNSTISLSVRTSSTNSNARAVHGEITSSSPGVFSAGVRGENNGTGFNGVGVFGSHAGFGYGVYGTSPGSVGVFGDSPNGFGVWGQSSVNTGIYASTSSGPQALESRNHGADTEAYLATEDYGVFATNTETPFRGVGIRGEGGYIGVEGVSEYIAQAGAAIGILGSAGLRESNIDASIGVNGVAQGSTQVGSRRVYGVLGSAHSGNSGNFTYGIYGVTQGPGELGNNRFAGYFEGDVHVDGTLSKSAGSFKIDHPLDPENKYLSHSFVESPDMMNIYNGVITLDAEGSAVVELPDYFEALNRDFRYQLTAMGAPMPNLYIASEISANQFMISGGVPNARVSWEVTGVRQDPSADLHRIVVEEDKPEHHQGKFLDPEAFGYGDDRSIHPRPKQN